MDDQLRQIMKALAEALRDSLPGSSGGWACVRATADGYHVWWTQHWYEAQLVTDEEFGLAVAR